MVLKPLAAPWLVCLQVMVSMMYGDTITVDHDVTVDSLVLMASDSIAGGGTIDFGTSRASFVVKSVFIFSDGTFTGDGKVCPAVSLLLVVGMLPVPSSLLGIKALEDCD